uniref:Ribosomal protein L6 n=1 Tax=Glaucocystis nostochinearum TaxID=38271 RepID=E9P6C5_9EUKA|nr:ribosomal protein L6 [Glaucocystis nostochinearum]ADW83109.1 ribosomal protein L6 [Glaucocystis nostochinearum]
MLLYKKSNLSMLNLPFSFYFDNNKENKFLKINVLNNLSYFLVNKYNNNKIKIIINKNKLTHFKKIYNLLFNSSNLNNQALSLKLVGIGYKAVIFYIQNTKETWLSLYLGYSHKHFILVPRFINIVTKKKRTILQFNGNLNNIKNFINLLKKFKKPNYYTGKGIFKFDENFKLKQGKKKV